MPNYLRPVAAWLVFLVVFVTYPFLAAAEEAKIRISIDEGIGGYAKRSSALPVKIEMENKGEAFSGTLLLQFQANYNYGGSKAIKVDLPKGSSKTYSIILPGYTDEYSSPSPIKKTIHLYDGDWKKGKEVDYTGPQVLTPKFVDYGEVLIGVLSENYDRLKELRVSSLSATQVIDLSKVDLPNQGSGYDVLNYLIVDEFSLSTLETQQQKAIDDWIQAGGILIAGATPNMSQQYGSLYESLPMKPNKEVSLDRSFFATVEGAPSFSKLPAFIGEVDQQAEVVIKGDTGPAVIKKEYGYGTIIQTSFSLGDEPLASWSKYGAWLHTAVLSPTTNSQLTQMDYLLNNLEWEMIEPNKIFEHTNFSIGQLLLLLVGYLLILIPILYVVLKKWDKREYAWWIIPIVAVISSIAIFALGAKDRIAKPQLNQLGIYQVKNSHVTGIQSDVLLSNKGGDYQLSVPKDEWIILPFAAEAFSSNPRRSPVVEEKATQIAVEFPNVEYWSTRSIIGKVNQKQVGQFTTNLKVENKELIGTIVNDFPYHFENIMIISGNQKWEFGALKQGGTLQVKQNIKNDLLMGPTISSIPGMQSWNPGQKVDLHKVRNDQLLYLTGQYFFTEQTTENAPVIIGLTNDKVSELKLENGEMEENNNNLLFQSFEPAVSLKGDVSLPKEMFQWGINVADGSFEKIQNTGNSLTYWFEVGEYEASSQIPAVIKDASFTAKKMTITWNDSNLKYELFNVKTRKYEAVKEGERTTTFEGSKEISSYVSQDGEIKVKLIKQNDPNGAENQLPAITVDGVIKP